MERSPSLSSSTTISSRQDERPLIQKTETVGSLTAKKLSDDSKEEDDEFATRNSTDVERAASGDDDPDIAAAVKPSRGRVMIWMIINTLATIGIVFTNKAIFSDPALTHLQFSFAAFHFALVYLTLHLLSRPFIAFFVPRRIAIRELLPLAITWALNVILTNLSLAYSTVTFYQIARILLTPVVACMEYVLYRMTLPRPALFALVPACLGVGVVSYYDTKPAPGTVEGDTRRTTSTLGVVSAAMGIFATSLYTVWVSSYKKRLNVEAMQLLHCQAPLGAFLLLYVIPFGDTFPVWREVPGGKWMMIFLSGALAILINISQFFIITQAGPVSSTVVGHVKTCCIVLLGWMTSGRAIGDKSVLGVFIALGGITSYSMAMIKHNKA